MTVPTLPAVAVIVSQAEKLLADPEALLDRSVQGSQPHQPVRGQVGRIVAQMAFELVRGRVAAQQQPDVGTRTEAATGDHALYMVALSVIRQEGIHQRFYQALR